MIRTWKRVPIDGFGDDYQVSNLGEIRSTKTGHYRVLKPKRNKHTGYLYVNLWNDGASITRSIHRLVALAFIPNPDNLTEVDHIDEDKTNNTVDNLRWVSTHDNNVHSKYKRNKPIELRTPEGELLATFVSGAALAYVFNMDKSEISKIAQGKKTSIHGFTLSFSKGGETDGR